MGTILSQHAASVEIIPKGLILGLSGNVIPSGFSDYTAANGFFIKGTTDNTLVGTKINKSAVSFNTANGGAHSSAGPKTWHFVIGYGWWTDNANSWGSDGSPGPYMSKKLNAANVFNHNHRLDFDYVPAANKMRLIKADSGLAAIPPGLILFGDGRDNGDHTSFATFNNNPNAALAASTATQTEAEVINASVLAGGAAHNHASNQSTRAYYNAQIAGATSFNSPGQNHNHSISNISVDIKLNSAVMRAFSLINNKAITGLIGLYEGDEIPWGWEIVAYMDDRYLFFDDSNFVQIDQPNTIQLSGNTSGWTHSHTFTGKATDYGGWINHSRSQTHSHSLNSGQVSYVPDTFILKFIRCIQ